ncbi:MAG: DUF998 domain-containing protein [Eubacteriales bacterium]|nr:DUF998 domain-containing protein [Eubacteriales bacterium]
MNIENPLFHAVLLLTIIGEFLLPYALKNYYDGYDSKSMVMSVLGSRESPVRFVYNLWLIWLGGVMLFTAFVYFIAAKEKFPVLSVLISLSIGIFAVGAGFFSGVFSINEKKGVITLASKIHGVGAAIGFTALLFFPLMQGILELKNRNIILGTVCIVSFILAFVFFIFFIMGDKEQFQNSILKYEGLWERMTLFFMYFPFVLKSFSILFK